MLVIFPISPEQPNTDWPLFCGAAPTPDPLELGRFRIHAVAAEAPGIVLEITQFSCHV